MPRILPYLLLWQVSGWFSAFPICSVFNWCEYGCSHGCSLNVFPFHSLPTPVPLWMITHCSFSLTLPVSKSTFYFIIFNLSKCFWFVHFELTSKAAECLSHVVRVYVLKMEIKIPAFSQHLLLVLYVKRQYTKT